MKVEEKSVVGGGEGGDGEGGGGGGAGSDEGCDDEGGHTGAGTAAGERSGTGTGAYPAPSAPVVQPPTPAALLAAQLHCNRSVALLRAGRHAEARAAAGAALGLDPAYAKARRRRAAAAEALGDAAAALEDMAALTAADPADADAAAAVTRLRPAADAQRDAQAAAVVSQLKDLGNSLLGRFGLSIDNFSATKDPETGQYSISFGQKGGSGGGDG